MSPLRLVLVQQPFMMELSIVSAAKSETRGIFKCERRLIYRNSSKIDGSGHKNVRKWCRECTGDVWKFIKKAVNFRRAKSLVEKSGKDQGSLLMNFLFRFLIFLGQLFRGFCLKNYYRKVCAWWILQIFIENHKWQRLETSRTFIQQCEDQKCKIFELYCYRGRNMSFTQKTKQNSRDWRHSTSLQSRKFKQAQPAGKVMANVF